MNNGAEWLPPLMVAEEVEKLVHKSWQNYDHVFEALNRPSLIRAIASAQDQLRLEHEAATIDAQRKLLLSAMRTLEPISETMLGEIFQLHFKQSRKFPEVWQLTNDRNKVVGYHIQTYQRLTMLECVIQNPSSEDTITKAWFNQIRSEVNRKYSKIYFAFINWTAPDDGSSPEP